MEKTRLTRIAGIGHFVPDKVVTNHDLEKLMDTSDQWIQERTGIRERRYAEKGTSSSDLGTLAARRALEDAGWKPEDLQFLVCATLSPAFYFPGNAVLLQRDLGIDGIGALDVRTQCTGFIYSLSVADAFIRMGMYDRVLVVGAECHSAGLRFDTAGRDTTVLFGDGGGAVCLEVTDGSDGSHFIWHHLHADGRHAEDLCVTRPGTAAHPWLTHDMIDQGLIYPHMNGREVFKHAIVRFPAVIQEALDKQGLSAAQLDLVIPHQANERITEAVRKRLDLPAEKVYSNIARYGNTTAASIPIAMSEAVKSGLLKRGQLVCAAAFGSGFTWGASLFRY